MNSWWERLLCLVFFSFFFFSDIPVLRGGNRPGNDVPRKFLDAERCRTGKVFICNIYWGAHCIITAHHSTCSPLMHLVSEECRVYGLKQVWDLHLLCAPRLGTLHECYARRKKEKRTKQLLINHEVGNFRFFVYNSIYRINRRKGRQDAPVNNPGSRLMCPPRGTNKHNSH